MIISKLNGGIGNQLFQYALGKNIATKINTNLKLDISDYTTDNNRKFELDKFNISATIADIEETNQYLKLTSKIKQFLLPHYSRPIIKEKHVHFDPDILKIKDDKLLSGYFQSEKYFLDIKSELINEFSLKKDYSIENHELTQKAKNTNSVSIHIRRGDYVTNKKFSEIYNILGNDYYQKSIELIKQKINNPIFFIFTDDLSQAKELLKNEAGIYIKDFGLRDEQELMLMSYCQHNIIANSSFSWWGAWLNTNENKIVIAPKDWYKNKWHNPKDIIPDNWIKI